MRGEDDLSPAARNIFAGHLDARRRLLTLLTDGRAIELPNAVRLNHLRRRVERWTDLLLAHTSGWTDVSEFAFEPARMLGGKSGYIRRFEWTPPDGVAVTQIQLYYAEDGRGYTATATTPSTQFERFEMQFRQLLGGLALDEG